MKGKICLITGTSSGIGKETALALADKGATVVMLCRNRERGRTAQKEIIEKTGNESVDLMTADLASQKQILKFADEFKKKYDRLHILINNAGSILRERLVTEDGIEKTFAENYLGHFILTHLLLNLLKAGSPARILNLSSVAHHGASIQFEDLFFEKNYSPMGAYRQSKLANILFTYYLAQQLAGTGVTVNCVHPGLVASNFGGSGSRLHRFFIALGKPFLLSSKKGSETSVYLASSPEVEGISGKYFVKKTPKKSSRISHDPAIQRRLWEASKKLAGINGPV
jgi:NAD(P)-dependent dehydrogenase (short-subunit alcohol dehydrogenase family)